MPILANPSHEKFAQGLADRLKQIDAYEAAGYPRSASSASQLANKEEVRNRVLELIEDRQRAAEQRRKDDANEPVPDLSFNWLVQQLQRNIQLAQTGGQIAAANKAIELLAEMHNFVGKHSGKPKDGNTPEDEKTPTDPTSNLGDLKGVMDKLGALIPPKATAEAAE